MVFGVANNFAPPAIRQDLVALGDVLLRVVGALGLHVGANLANQGAHVRFVKKNYRIHVSQCGDYLRALRSRHQRASRSLEPGDAVVRIHRHHQLSAQRLRAMQIANVPNVQQVKAAIGQHDRLAAVPPLCYAVTQSVARKKFLYVVAHEDVIAEYWSMAASNSWFDTVAVPRVITSDSRAISFMSRSPAQKSFWSSWPILMPNASSTSGSLGVAAVTPSKSSMR